MAFSYHPPTRSSCKVCEHLLQAYPAEPLIGTFEGRSCMANGYPFMTGTISYWVIRQSSRNICYSGKGFVLETETLCLIHSTVPAQRSLSVN